MIRGTTPKLEFTLPFQVDQLDEAYISFAQNGLVVMEKTLTECETNDKTIIVRLSQTDTLKLKCESIVEVQIRAKMISGDAVASNIIRLNADRIIKDGVI